MATKFVSSSKKLADKATEKKTQASENKSAMETSAPAKSSKGTKTPTPPRTKTKETPQPSPTQASSKASTTPTKPKTKKAAPAQQETPTKKGGKVGGAKKVGSFDKIEDAHKALGRKTHKDDATKHVRGSGKEGHIQRRYSSVSGTTYHVYEGPK